MKSKFWIIVWVILVLSMIPGAMNYSHYLTYTQKSSTHSLADEIISNTSLDRDTMFIVVNESPFATGMAKTALYLQGNISKLNGVANVTSPFSQYDEFLAKIYGNETFARYYLFTHGLNGAPSFVRSLISSNNKSFLITVTLNYSSNFVFKNGTTPSQILTPRVEELTSRYINNSFVTGIGPISYDTQILTQKYGFVFPSLFLILTIAIGLTLRSVKGALLGFMFVGLTLLISYFAIYITGLILGGVDYVVNYTLTAVILGITTDYFVLTVYRFRNESNYSNAIQSLKTSSRTVLISGITVGVSLSTFSLIKGFLSWGIVLLIAVLLSTFMLVTLLPSVLELLGRRITSKNIRSRGRTGSLFYRLAKLSKWTLILIIFLAIPAIYFFFHVPTSYNFNSGLPSNLESVKGLNLLQKDFGSFSPIIIITNHSEASQNITNILEKYGKVIGPYVNGENLSQFILKKSYVYWLVYTNSSPYSSASLNTVETLENQGLIVGGLSADILYMMKSNTVNYLLLEILVITSVFMVLTISFRTWKYAIISLSGVFMSVSWAISLLYIISKVFLHLELIYLVPVIIFVILTSVGSDYSVFIISKVEEEKRKGGNYVPRALSETGNIVTALGIILGISLGILALIPVGFLEELGIAFFISIIVDTFIIRAIYYPIMIRTLFKNE